MLYSTNDTITQRYRIIAPLGSGSMGTTYEAEDLTNCKRVAIKVVSLRHVADWKVLELFDREAKVLAHLSHPNIPHYLDYFHLDTRDDRCFYLVRELIAGRSLADWVQLGWHTNEAEIDNIATELLSCLHYLHSLRPPIVHRDIKPQNIIRRNDGRAFLVDFGAVRDVYRHTLTGSGTFVGTLGYMSPEQFSGRVVPATDLYALGATLLFLLTHRSPHEFPQKRMKIDFRDRISMSDRLADWLEKMLEPAIEDRFQSATDAFVSLTHKPTSPVEKVREQKLDLEIIDIFRNPSVPSKNIHIERTGDRLYIHVPAKRGTVETFAASLLFIGTCLWLPFAILFGWTQGIGLGLLSLFGLAYFIFNQCREVNLEMTPEVTVLSERNAWEKNKFKFPNDKIIVRVAYNYQEKGDPAVSCRLQVGHRKLGFFFEIASGFPPQDIERLGLEIDNFIQETRYHCLSRG